MTSRASRLVNRFSFLALFSGLVLAVSPLAAEAYKLTINDVVNQMDRMLSVPNPSAVQPGDTLPDEATRLAAMPFDSALYYQGNAQWPAAAAGNNTIGVSWCDNRDGKYRIYFVVLNQEGQPLTMPADVSGDVAYASRSHLVYNGTDWAIVWEDWSHGFLRPELYFRRVNAMGQPVASAVQLTNSYTRSHSPFIVYLPQQNRYAMTFIDNRERFQGVYDENPDRNKPKVEEVQISLAMGDTARREALRRQEAERYRRAAEEEAARREAANQTATPEIPEEDRQFRNLTTLRFEQTGYFGYSVLFETLDANGNRIGPEMRVSPTHWDGYRPVLAFNGEDFSVLYTKPSELGQALFFRRFDRAGFPMTVERQLYEGNRVGDLSLVSQGGGNYLTAWSDVANTDMARRASTIHLARLDNDATITRTVQLRSTGQFAAFPQVTVQNGEYVLTYADSTSRFDMNVYLYHRTFAADLTSVGQEVRVSEVPGAVVSNVVGSVHIYQASSDNRTNRIYITKLGR